MLSNEEAVVIRLDDMIETIGEDEVKVILSSFSCPKNPDIEKFLKTNSINFIKQRIAITYLVFAIKDRKICALCGYFTLVNKFVSVPQDSALSKTNIKKLSKYASYDGNLRLYNVPIPLIAQLGKNYFNGADELISGADLLGLASERVDNVLQQIGGNYEFIECENNDKLIQFYKNNGFIEFNTRPVDKDEDDINGTHLVQMLKHFH